MKKIMLLTLGAVAFIFMFSFLINTAAQRSAQNIAKYVVIQDEPTADVMSDFYLNDKPEARMIANCQITVYTPHSDSGKWGYYTSTPGAFSKHLATCAVDPDVIPLGSVIQVGGLTLSAIDTGSAVKGNMIDVFYDGSIADAREWISTFGDCHEVIIIEEEVK